jgi:predicted metal-binding protein
MRKHMKIGIIICNRYGSCGGGKCFRAFHRREGAFDVYKEDEHAEIVGFANCGGCPGGNIEYVPEEMKKNGAEIIHLATGFIVGYPPCPHIKHFRDLIKERFDMEVIVGTHPIPQKYLNTHLKLGTWESSPMRGLITATLTNKRLRQSYD